MAVPVLLRRAQHLEIGEGRGRGGPVLLQHGLQRVAGGVHLFPGAADDIGADDAGGGLAPGTAFGDVGEGYVRLCFAASPGRLNKALDRLERILVGGGE